MNEVEPRGAPLTLFTIGHSNGGIEEFIAVLREHGVERLIDIRSRPRSRFARFNGRQLATSLQSAGLDYAYMGDQLGGLPRDPSFASLWKQGSINPDVIAHLRLTDDWQQGVTKLSMLVGDDDARLCIMCSERDPQHCHRSAVAEDVAERLPGLSVVHLIAAPR